MPTSICCSGKPIVASDLIENDEFRERSFKLHGGGFTWDSARPGNGRAVDLIAIQRTVVTEAGPKVITRYVHRSQVVHLIPGLARYR